MDTDAVDDPSVAAPPPSPLPVWPCRPGVHLLCVSLASHEWLKTSTVVPGLLPGIVLEVGTCPCSSPKYLMGILLGGGRLLGKSFVFFAKWGMGGSLSFLRDSAVSTRDSGSWRHRVAWGRVSLWWQSWYSKAGGAEDGKQHGPESLSRWMTNPIPVGQRSCPKTRCRGNTFSLLFKPF